MLLARFSVGQYIVLPVLLVAFLAAPLEAQTPQESQQAAAVSDQAIDVDFLFNYYEQDGEHSPVTGGIGTEEMTVISPVIVVQWQLNDDWSLATNLGVDNITSASTDNIDNNVSSASRQDARAFTSVTATRTFENQELGLTAGYSNEFDYQSIQAGVAWSRGFRQNNSNIAASLHYYSDTIDLYDINGVNQAQGNRTTTDISLSLTQVLSKKTVGSIELYASSQDGFLSTAFHEVILAPNANSPAGERVTERLPDSRFRSALGLRLNHAFSKKIVQRSLYRFYDDDWGIQAHTIELETHFRLPTEAEQWVFPILRYHSQTESNYFGLPATFLGNEEFISADRDLSEFTSEKFGIGWRIKPRIDSGWLRRLRNFETRISSYSRDDGLDALSVSFGVGWRF